MRSFLLVSPLVALFSALCTHAVAAGGETSVKRFDVEGTQVTRTLNLTEAELHARSLTHRSPTRRSTAKRRQVSERPEVILDFTIEANNFATHSLLGSLAVGASGLEITAGTPATFQTSYDTTQVVMSDRRVTIPGFVTYPNAGLVQESTTSGITLGFGSSNGVILSAVAEPGTTPSSTPVTDVANYMTGATGLGVETDVWLVIGIFGEISPQWTNPDSSRPTTYLVTDGRSIAVTGDVDPFNAEHVGDWIQISLSFTIVV